MVVETAAASDFFPNAETGIFTASSLPVLSPPLQEEDVSRKEREFRGRIGDWESHDPLQDVRILIREIRTDDEYFLMSDDDGRFSGKIGTGEHFICIWRKGYYSPYYHVLIREDQKPYVLNASLVERRKDRLTGVVYDEEGRPVSGAAVAMEVYGTSVRTDENGTYVFDAVPAELQTLTVRKAGFLQKSYHLWQSEYHQYQLNTLNIGLIRLDDAIVAGPDGGIIHKKGGTVIILPEGALESPTEIRITTIPSEFYERDENGEPIPNPAIHLDFRPAGLELKKPVQVITTALTPKRFAPDTDTYGEIPVFNEKIGKKEMVKARFKKSDHTIRYELNHFIRTIRRESGECRFAGREMRKEAVEAQPLYRECIPEGCRNCFEQDFYTQWQISGDITDYLDFKSVRITGEILDRTGSCRTCIGGRPYDLREAYYIIRGSGVCSAPKCRELEFGVTGQGLFEISAYQCGPWFMKKVFLYRTELNQYSARAVCKDGGPCGEGLRCGPEPSDCCYRVCSDGKCGRFIPKEEIPVCNRCDERTGFCHPYPDDPRPCSDDDPCTRNDRCRGNRCLGEPMTSRENPNCP